VTIAGLRGLIEIKVGNDRAAILCRPFQEAEMPADVQISFRGMEASPSVEAQVRHRAEELMQLSDRVTACQVMIEAAHRRHRQGRIYHVRVDLTVPGSEVVVNREPGEDHAHEDLHVAVRDAFDTARRRLEDHMRRLDGMTKQHAAPSIGRIANVFAERDYAFLETDTGEEVYVHRNAVVAGKFDRLNVGDRVRYVIDPGEGEKGAQASTVVPLD
jgi:cold shock CspA family protein/ribosome-associated translation inhibitor RaiA